MLFRLFCDIWKEIILKDYIAISWIFVNTCHLMITQDLEQIHIIQFCIYSLEIYQAAG